jgi:predicted MFS family arabinose efflux permease
MSAVAAGTMLEGRATQLRTLVACSAGSCIGNVAWWIQPELISQLVATGRLSEAQAGLVASVELAALAVSSVVLSRVLRNTSLRLLGVAGAAVAVGATVVSLLALSYPVLLAARMVVGAGEGAAFLAANLAASRFSDPDRAFGKITFVNIIFGIALVAINPWFRGTVGETAALPALLAALVLLAPLFLFMPQFLRIERTNGGSPAPIPTEARRARSYATPALMLSFFLVSIMSASIWAFYGVIGTQSGLTDNQVNDAIAIAVMGALVGGAVAPLLGASFGRLLPVTFGVLLLTGAMLALCLTHHPLIFRIATCFNVGANYILLPYYLGAAAEEDPSGKAASLIGGTFLLIGAIGPYLGGLLMETVGLRAMSAFILVTCGAGWIAFVMSNAEIKRDVRRRASLQTA